MADVSTRGVPVSFGSPKFDTIACGPFLVTNAQFPAAHRLEKHFHDRTVLGITVAGEWDSIVGATRLANAPAMLHVEPAGDCHVNQFGSQGAHVVVIQPDQSDRLLEPFKSLLAGAFQIRVGLPGLQIAERLRREIGWQDDLTPWQWRVCAWSCWWRRRAHSVSAMERVQPGCCGRLIMPMRNSSKGLPCASWERSRESAQSISTGSFAACIA